jgi:hypothetical protein
MYLVHIAVSGVCPGPGRDYEVRGAVEIDRIRITRVT